MIRSLLLAMGVFLAFSSEAQKIPLIHSGEVIDAGKQLYDSAKYEDAIRKYLTVPRRDTNYVYMLTELALAYHANQQYDKAIEVCNDALKEPSEHHAHLLRTRAIATDRKGDFAAAVALFKSALERYPLDASLHYNLGITYYNHKDYDLATGCFFKVLSINPFHGGSHFNLGRIAIGRGRKTHAMFALGMYLSVNNTDNERLVMVDKLVSNQVPEEGSLPVSGGNGCEKLDQIIRAKIALDKKFESAIPVDAPVVRQYEMMFQQLQTINAAADDPWVKYYLPLYQTVKDQKQVEPFMYHLLASASNDHVKKWRKKNEKTLDAYYPVMNGALQKGRETQKVFALKQAVPAWYDTNNKIEGLGEQPGGTHQGPWIFFHTNGERSAEGNYDASGKKAGVWTYYNNTGAVKSVENYGTGEVTVYGTDGAKRQHFYLKDDKINGDVELYHPCGGLREKLLYKDGERHGKGKSFFPNGSVDVAFEYVEGKNNGEYLSYFENGVLYSKSFYKNDELQGDYVQYYASGALRMKGQYLNDKANGRWEYYYNNGRKEKSGEYANGLSVGEWQFWDTRGKLTEKRLFNKEGELHGENTFYYDGKLHYQQTFKEDVLVQIIFYAQDGKEIAKHGHNSGTFTAKTYYPTGQVNGEGAYKKGKVSGTWKYYQPEGAQLSQYTYVDGLVQGEAFEVFRNGKKKFIFNYKDNRLHGYYQEFYVDGTIKEEGWFQNGERQQQWLGYFMDGNVETDAYYLNDALTGDYLDYNYDTKLYSKITHDAEGIAAVQDFNSKGEMVSKMREDKGVKVYETFYKTGKLHSRISLRCGSYTGEVVKWYPNGKTLYSYHTLSGRRHGRYQNYGINQKLAVEGNYVNGSREGKWTGYYYSGQPEYIGSYLHNEADSIWTYYHEHGKVSSLIPYRNDLRDGVARYNTPEGTPAVEKLFIDDDLIRYRVAKADGTFGEWQPFTPSTTITANYADGKKAWEEQYKDGLLTGVKRLYFSNGTLFSEVAYQNGERNGPFTIFHPTGKVSVKGTYKGGEYHGLIEWYNADGTLAKQEQHITGSKNGKAVVYNKGVKTVDYTCWAGSPE